MGGTIALIAVSAIVSAISGYMGAEAQKQAYQALANATEEEKKMLQEEYDKAYGKGSYNAKMQEIGLGATEDIQSLLANEEAWDKYVSGEKAWQEYPEFSFTAEDLYGDPSYQVRLDEGRKALEDSLVTQGYGGTGYAAKELEKYAQEQASKEYANAYNRAYTQYSDDRNFDYTAWKNEANQYYQNLQTQLAGLQGLSSQGQQANTNQTNALMTLAGQKANAGIQSATAQAAADQADASKTTSALDAIAKGFSTGAGASMAYDLKTPTNTSSTSSNDTEDMLNAISQYMSGKYLTPSTTTPSTGDLTMGA